MKWILVALTVSLCSMAQISQAQRPITLDIGNIAQIEDRAPTMWGMSGMQIFRISQSLGNVTPIMRTEEMDARTVEILSRTQAPPLRASDIRAVQSNGRDYIAVRRFMLLEVKPQDARAEKASTSALTRRWADQVRRVLPQVCPMPNRFGI